MKAVPYCLYFPQSLSTLLMPAVTAGLGAPEMAIACNAAQGLCMTACAGGLLLSPTP